jgi:hypothetical protein
MLALKSLTVLTERHPNYQKTVPSKIKLLHHWLKLSEEQRKAAIPDERLYKIAVQQIESLGGASSLDQLKSQSD